MKKRILGLFLGFVCLLGLAGCKLKETVYNVEKRDFYYSIDNGATYGNERVELEVGQTILMKVLVTVTTNKKDKEEINTMEQELKAIFDNYAYSQMTYKEYQNYLLDKIKKIAQYYFFGLVVQDKIIEICKISIKDGD